jgi:hypothetical protein
VRKEAAHNTHLEWNVLTAISDLGGHAKQLLAGHQFPDREALLEAVGRSLERIGKIT